MACIRTPKRPKFVAQQGFSPVDMAGRKLWPVPELRKWEPYCLAYSAIMNHAYNSSRRPVWERISEYLQGLR